MNKAPLISGTFPGKDFFPCGVHYYCAPTPLPEDWEHDLPQIAAAGYTHIQFRPLWRWHERVRGEFVWDDMDRLFELAAKYNVRVILKPMLENAPDWVFSELDGGRIGFHGVPITRFAMNSAYYEGGYMPCFDNPRVIEAGSRFVRNLVERYKDSPALWCYNAWNEPISRPLGQCNCEFSVESYRQWLKDRFGTIEELNTKLYKSWTSYDDVIPPVSNADLIEMFLWRQWAATAVAEQTNFVKQAIRSVDSDTPIIMHSVGCNVAVDPACGASDDFQNCVGLDRYGFSLKLPYAPTALLDYNETEFQSSWMRRIDPDYWCQEFYPKSPKWGAHTDPQLLTQYIWMVLAGGCSGLTFWEYRTVRMGIMSAGFGVRDLDGSETQTSRVCEGFTQLIRQKGPLLRQTRRPQASVAMMHCAQSDLLNRLMGMNIWMGNSSTVSPSVDYAYKNSIRAAHLAWQENGESVDWVVSGDDLSGVKLLHLTCVEIVTESTAQWLKEYVESGGVLVVEHPFAARDEKTWLAMKRPALGLDALCGCTEQSRIALPDGVTETASFENGIQIAAKEIRIGLEPLDGARVLARWPDGTAAAVCNRIGQGAVFSLGVNAALSYSGGREDPLFDLYGTLLKDAGLKDTAFEPDPQLWVRRRVGDGFEIWFVFNVSEEKKIVELPERPFAVWQAVNTEQNGNRFELGAGGTLVVQMGNV